MRASRARGQSHGPIMHNRPRRDAFRPPIAIGREGWRFRLPPAVHLARVAHTEFEDKSSFLRWRLAWLRFGTPAAGDLDAGLPDYREIDRARANACCRATARIR
jgi:hypothetical protein